MFGQLLHSEYFFWFLIFLFYFIDNVQLVENHKLLIIEDIFGKFVPQYSFSNFEIFGKQVQILNIFVPSNGVLKLDSVPSEAPSANFQETVTELILFQEKVFLFKIISLTSFFYLLSGPVLTSYFGLGATLVLLIPFHLSALAFTLILLLFRKSTLGLTKRDVAHLTFDCLVMPAYLPNVVRKIYYRKKFRCDGNFFALETSKQSNREFIEYSVRRKINYLAEQVGNDEFDRYLAYRNKLE